MAIKGADPLQLGPWPKGVYYNIPVEEVPADGLSDLCNVRIGLAGQCKKRPGCASFHSLTTLGATTAVTLACDFKTTAGTTYTVIAAGTGLYQYATTWTAITGGTITAGNDNVFSWANANGTLVICNGVDDAAIKWTGTGAAAALDVDGRFTKPTFVVWWDDRLWCGRVSGTLNRVWYSAKGDPETYATTDFKSVGASISGMAAFDDMLTIHTETGIWAITPTGNSTIPYAVKQVIAERGSLSGRAIVTLPGRRQLFPLSDGIYRWSEQDGTVEKISYQLDDGYWPSLIGSRLAYSFAVFYPSLNETWFALPYGTSQTKMNHLMIYGEYEDDGGKQFRWYGPWKGGTAYERASGGLVGGKPHMGGYDGILYDMDTGMNDVSTRVAAWFATGAPSPTEKSDAQHRWLFARTYYDPTGAYPLTVSQEGNDLIGATETFLQQDAGFILGSSHLGDPLAARSMGYYDTKLQGYGANMSMKYANAALSQTFSVRRVHVHHKLLGQRRKRKKGT